MAVQSDDNGDEGLHTSLISVGFLYDNFPFVHIIQVS